MVNKRPVPGRGSRLTRELLTGGQQGAGSRTCRGSEYVVSTSRTGETLTAGQRVNRGRPGTHPERRDYTRPRWTCTSSGRLRRPSSGQLWMPSLGRLRRVGSAARAIVRRTAMQQPAVTRSAVGGRSCCRHSTPSSPGSAGSASRRSTTSAVASPSPPPMHMVSPRSTRCSRRHRGRRPSPMSVMTSHAGSPARSRSVEDLTRAVGPAGEAARRRPDRLAAVAMSRALRPRPGRDGDGRRRNPDHVRHRPGGRRRHHRPARGRWWDRRGRQRRYARSPRNHGSSPPSRCRRPVVTRRLRGQRRVRRTESAVEIGPDAVIAEVTTSNSSVAAAPRSPPDGNGPPWRSRPPSPTTWCATRTSPSRARSRTEFSSRVTRSPSSKR